MNLRIAILIVLGCAYFHLVSSQSFRENCRLAHNYYRKRHGGANLVLNNHLTNLAKEWATHLAQTGSVQRRPNNPYGESIFLTTNFQSSAAVVQGWYNEIQVYDFSRPGSSRIADHFSQIVWLNTKRIGCAASTNRGVTVVVCNYDPKGNIPGRFADNVKRPG